MFGAIQTIVRPGFANVRSHLRAALVAATVPMLACASQRQLIVPTTPVDASFSLVNSYIEDARRLFAEGYYDSAARVLKSIGQQSRTYYRMDEVLLEIARCRLMQGDPRRAERAVTLLLDRYPQCRARLPGLEDLVSAVRDSLLLHQGDEYESPSGDRPDGSFLAHSNPPNESQPADGPTVTNVFYETDVRQALADISAQTGVSIVPDAFVGGYVTVEFNDTPLELALERLLYPLGFTYRKIKDYYLVGSSSVDSPSFLLLSETRRIRPRFLSCEEVKKLISTNYEKYIRFDPAANALTITAPRSVIDKFEEDVARIDRPRAKVMIEALVVEMSSEARRSLGLDWRYLSREGDQVFRALKHFPSGFDSTFVGEFVRMKDAFDLRMAIRALAARGKAKIRANPRVATVDGREAEIRIAKEVYFSLVQGSVNFPYFTLEKIPTGITLKITPHVGESCEITTDIRAEVSDVVGMALNELPVTNVRSVDTRISVMNGETIAIGGLVSERQQKETNRIPVLGDIPFLGALFGHTSTVSEESEIVILIVPHILIDSTEFDLL